MVDFDPLIEPRNNIEWLKGFDLIQVKRICSVPPGFEGKLVFCHEQSSKWCVTPPANPGPSINFYAIQTAKGNIP